MDRIAIVCNATDTRQAKALAAHMRRLLDLTRFELWLKTESESAFDDMFSQVNDAIADAWAVIVVVGEEGVGDAFSNSTNSVIQQRIAESGREFGRLVVMLPHSSSLPRPLQVWAKVETDEATLPTAAQRVLELLRIRPRWSENLFIDGAKNCFLAGPDRPALINHFTEVAQMLADGKPLTLMVGPYASVEELDDGSCPSRVRRQLLALLDPDLRELLRPLEVAADVGILPPLLWQDHLATLCILSGSTREEVASTIEQAIGEASGDLGGEPHGQFKAIGALVAQLKAAQLPRQAGMPAVTLLTVCPGLRLERSLIAANCAFERASLRLGQSTEPALHHMTYRPRDMLMQRAAIGNRAFMPEGEAPLPADEVEFVRLVKLCGSRDLDNGVPSGDLGQAYDLMGALRRLLESFVASAGSGPYVLLGGGLCTPPMQAAHAVLLRSVLEKPERRPRLAIVPSNSASPDPLRRAETGRRLARLVAVPNSGFDRLKIVLTDPVCFLDALTVAFGGSPTKPPQQEAV